MNTNIEKNKNYIDNKFDIESNLPIKEDEFYLDFCANNQETSDMIISDELYSDETSYKDLNKPSEAKPMEEESLLNVKYYDDSSKILGDYTEANRLPVKSKYDKYFVKSEDLQWKNGTGMEFISNNSLKPGTINATLLELKNLGISIWYENKKINIKNNDNEIESLDPSQAQIMLSSKLNRTIFIGNNDDADIPFCNLISVDSVEFNVKINCEFYSKGNIIYRNIFKPTSYMSLNKTNKSNVTSFDFPAIYKLLLNLFLTTPYIVYFINWLAYFFQNLVKSPVTVVNTGPQGAGKDILFIRIITSLFGKKQTFQVNDKAIRSNFIASMFENKLFVNLDEISSSAKDQTHLASIIKALISNQSASLEKKFQNMDKETPLYAQCLFSSNSFAPVKIEHKDRRFSVFTTGENISKSDYLGYGTYHNLINTINEELENFAYYLLNYDVDEKQATVALNTPAKEAIIGLTTDRVENFLNALKEKNLEYFRDLREPILGPNLYWEIKESFQNNRILRKNLTRFFNALEEEDMSAKKILARIRTIDPLFVSRENSVGRANGDVLFKLNPDVQIKETDYENETISQVNSFLPQPQNVASSLLCTNNGGSQIAYNLIPPKIPDTNNGTIIVYENYKNPPKIPNAHNNVICDRI